MSSQISIHALLAESDNLGVSIIQLIKHFYPRSPCGERPVKLFRQNFECFISIHALLAESDESRQPCARPTTDFYPRSPCGERLNTWPVGRYQIIFLSTLSLRRATQKGRASVSQRKFLSTLSLRRATIHKAPYTNFHDIFLSTLSLRRATCR